MIDLPPTEHAKTMARRLRAALAQTGVEVGHSAALELIAQTYGLRDWNTFTATAPDSATAPAANNGDGDGDVDRETEQAVIPILRIFAWEAAVEFYLEYLGFALDWEHTFEDHLPRYCQVSGPDGVLLHLSEHHGDGTPGTAVLIHVTDVVGLHTRLAGLDYRFARPGLEQAPWGATTLTVSDPFGNRLTFAGPDAAADRISGEQAAIVHEVTIALPAEQAYDRFIGFSWWRDYGLDDGGQVVFERDRISFRNPGGETEFGRVLSRYRPTRWLQTFTLAQDQDHPTTLDVTLEPLDDGTRVRLSHGGWNEANVHHRSRFTDWPTILGYYADLG